MRYLLLLSGLFFLSGLSAQTKKIAFKSHSGSAENFSIALENNLFDMGNSNFGHAPDRTVRTAQLDSVIFVSDTLAILVTSEYCSRESRSSGIPKGSTRWRAGREPVYSHPLFSRKHSLDSIRTVVKEQYNFQNQVDKVVFVGYDNKKTKTKKNKNKNNMVAPLVTEPGDNNQSPFGPAFIVMASLVVFLSLVAGLGFHYYSRWKKSSMNNDIATA